MVVTGMGLVTGLGIGVEENWELLLRGEHGISALRLFEPEGHRTGIAAEVPGQGPAPSRPLHARLRGRRLSRTDRFALTAAMEAWGQADLSLEEPPERMGLYFGSSTGGLYEGECAFLEHARTRRRLRGRDYAPQPNGTPADTVAAVLGVSGPVEAIGTACAASTLSIEGALDALRAGEVEIALAGGADGLCQTTYGGFNSLRAVDERPARPFRLDREGLSLGEGAGFVVLETREHARRRGARPLVILAGSGSSCDANHMTAPLPDGGGAARAIQQALADAGLSSADVSFINAHGSGTPHNDAAESAAFRSIFSDRVGRIPVTSTKGALGHSLGTCGAIEAIVTARCLMGGVVHPTPGGGALDPEAAVDLVVGSPRVLEAPRAGVSVNLAFGGANAALVLTLPEGQT